MDKQLKRVIITLLLLALSVYGQSMLSITGGVPAPAGGGGGTGAVTRVGSLSGVDTSLTQMLNPAPTPGHIVVVSVAAYNCTAVTLTVTDNQSGNTYTKATTDTQNTAKSCTAWFTAPNINSTGTFNLTLTSSGADYLRMHVYDVDSAVTSSVVDTVATPTNTNASSSSGTVTLATTAAHTVVFGNFSGGSAATTTEGSGYTLGYSDDSVSTVIVTLSDVYLIATTNTTYFPNVTWGLPQASGYVSQAISVKY